jgi:hypothetical protein
LVYSFDKTIDLMEGEIAGHLVFYSMDEKDALKNALKSHPLTAIEEQTLSLMTKKNEMQ